MADNSNTKKDPVVMGGWDPTKQTLAEYEYSIRAGQYADVKGTETYTYGYRQNTATRETMVRNPLEIENEKKRQALAAAKSSDYDTRLKKYQEVAATVRGLVEASIMSPGKSALMVSSKYASLLSPVKLATDAENKNLLQAEAGRDFGRGGI